MKVSAGFRSAVPRPVPAEVATGRLQRMEKLVDLA